MRVPTLAILAPLALGPTACTGAPEGAARPVVITPCASPTGVSLRGLAVVDTKVVWASGADGTVLRTVDGGVTWERVPCPDAAGRDLRDVAAFDARTALVMAVDRPARIWRTTDAGASWTLVLDHDADGAFLDSITFADDRHGFTWGDPVDGAFLAFATDDGGLTWQRIDSMPAPDDGEAGFAASGSCIAMVDGAIHVATGGTRTRCLTSRDGGATWTTADWPLAAGAASTGAFALAFADAEHGVVVGGDYLAPELGTGNAAFTTDGGRTFAAPTGAAPPGYRSGVAPFGGGTWIAVGPTGTDVSHDDGRSWRGVVDAGFHAVGSAAGSSVGFAVGADGRIARIDVGR